MKKIMIVGILAGLAAGTWMPMVQAAPKDDLKKATDIANVVKGLTDPIAGVLKTLGIPADAVDKLKMTVNLGTTSIITAGTLSQTIDDFPTRSQKAATDLRAAVALVKAAADKLKNPTLTDTAEKQMEVLIEYLQAQGQFVDVIASYLVYVDGHLVNPVFSLLEAMPFVGPKIVMTDPDSQKLTKISDVLGGMLGSLAARNETYKKAVAQLPTIVKSVEKAAASGTTETAAPAVKSADLGF